MTLDAHVRTLGRGPGRSRSLTQEEAADAMRLMLEENTAPEAIGALLMLLRMKGEVPEEIAGFTQAAQDALETVPDADLDWPSYAAGRTRGQPYFLLSARLVALAGHRVLLHGWNGPDPKVRAGLAEAGIPVARTPSEATAYLDAQNIAYLPLEAFHPRLLHLLRLREVLGLRSCINTVCRMLNPGRAPAGVQGVFHPSYRSLQTDAAQRLGQKSLTVIKGGGGEFERTPSKDVTAFGLRKGAPWQTVCAARVDETRRLASDQSPSLSDLMTATAPPAFERETVLGTAVLALESLGHDNADAKATALFDTLRHRNAA